ncbi:MAG: SRPBCC family protein [Gaiellaceae bacterium]
MYRNEHTVEIAAPPERVFPHVVESERRLAWMGALSESEPLSDGPLAVGSRFRDVFVDHGQRVELEAEVVRYEPPRYLEVRLRGDGVEATSSQTLEPLAGGTRLSALIEAEYKKRLLRMVAGVVTRHAQARLESDLAALKELVESEPA